MAELDYDSLDPGDQITGASLTSRFSSITTVINDLDPATLASGALNQNHLASGVSASGVMVRTGTTAYSNLNSAGSDYGNGTSPNFAGLNVGGNVEVDLGVLQILGGRIGGVLVCADILVKKIRRDSGANDHAEQDFVALRVEGSVNGASWTGITKSERKMADHFQVDNPGDQDFHVPLRTLITATEMASGVRYVRVAISVSGSVAGGAVQTLVNITNARLAVLSLQSSLV